MHAKHQQEILIEHSQAPRNKGEPPHYDATSTHLDRETGDTVTVWICGDSQSIRSIRWGAKGSSILMASCSLMSEHIEGVSIPEALSRIHTFIDMLTSVEDDPDLNCLGDAAALAGIRHLPARVRCASLPWRTAESALKKL